MQDLVLDSVEENRSEFLMFCISPGKFLFFFLRYVTIGYYRCSSLYSFMVTVRADS